MNIFKKKLNINAQNSLGSNEQSHLSLSPDKHSLLF